MNEKKEFVVCKVSTNALMLWEDKILLVRLNKPSNKIGLWSLPGGKVDLGESFDECLVREVYEETGISSNQYSYQRVAILHDAPNTTCKHIYVCNLKDVVNSFSFDSNEIMDVCFFDLTEKSLIDLKFRNDWVYPLIKNYMDGGLVNCICSIG